MQDIGYSIGFAKQPNFNLIFKKNTGITPAEFRKQYHASQTSPTVVYHSPARPLRAES
nr:helix-turn-helix domain-containing protein [Dawidia soli]